MNNTMNLDIVSSILVITLQVHVLWEDFSPICFSRDDTEALVRLHMV